MIFNSPTFIHFDDILYYDGPLLSIGLTENHQVMLQVFCDCDDDFNYYVNVSIPKKEIELFIDSKLSYYDVLPHCTNLSAFKTNATGYEFWCNMSLAEFLENYGPQPDSNVFLNSVVNENFVNSWKSYLAKC